MTERDERKNMNGKRVLNKTNTHKDYRMTLYGHIENNLSEIRKRNGGVKNSKEEIDYLLHSIPYIRRQYLNDDPNSNGHKDKEKYENTFFSEDNNFNNTNLSRNDEKENDVENKGGNISDVIKNEFSKTSKGKRKDKDKNNPNSKSIHSFLSLPSQSSQPDKDSDKDKDNDEKRKENFNMTKSTPKSARNYISSISSNSYNLGVSNCVDINKFVNRKMLSNNGEIYSDFMKNIHKVYIDTDNFYPHNDDILKCGTCENQMSVIHREAIAVCENCGHTECYQDFTDIKSLSTIDLSNAVYYVPYKRINHFREWLTQIQAKESTVIPPDIIDKILKEIKKERIYDPNKVTRERVKKYLKKIDASRYYEHIPVIIHKISGKEPPSISYETEQELIEMFKLIQEPFNKNIPKGRKNFLSYSYTLHKFCQLIDREDLLPLFPLLKSRDKLYQQDMIWKSICNELDWNFIPSL